MSTANVSHSREQNAEALNALDVFVIGHGIVIDGSVSAPKNSMLVVHGIVNGAVKSGGSVEISETGEVVGFIEAENLDINGRVRQSTPDDGVSASGHLAIGDSGLLSAGKVVYGSLSVARGARVSGVLHHIEADVSDRSPAPSTVSTVIALRSEGKKDGVAPQAPKQDFANRVEDAQAQEGSRDPLSENETGTGPLEMPLPQHDAREYIPQFLMLNPQSEGSDEHKATLDAPLDGFEALTAADEDGDEDNGHA